MSFKSLNYSSSLLALAFLLFSAVLQSEAIINGENAQLGEFPYIVLFRNKSGNHYCAGTLITRKHIVTAAHCTYEDSDVLDGGEVKKLKPEDNSVVVGTLSSTKGGDSYEIERFVPHPDYDITNPFKQNDIAVVVLKAPVNTPKVPTTWSNVTDIPEDDTVGTTAGWGLVQLEPVEVNATVLQKMTVKIQNREVCKNEWKNKLFSMSELPPEPEKIIDTIISQNIICALPNPNNAGSCFTDSGNPLIINNQFVGFLIVAYACATGIADLFIPLAAYRPFVQQVIDGEIK